jgi:hypothetical protein
MKLLTLALILAPSIAMADYVSPTEYKDFTCDELRADYYDLGSMMIDNLSESLDYDYRSQRRFDLDQEYKAMKSRQSAIEKAAKRIECDLKNPVATTE